MTRIPSFADVKFEETKASGVTPLDTVGETSTNYA